MSKSVEIAAKAKKYNETVEVADSLGRIISVGRLKPSQQLAVQEFAGALTGSTTIQDDATGKFHEVPRAMPLIMAASVRKIDEFIVTFPRSRAELNATLDTLDDEGLIAVMEGLGKLNGDDKRAPSKEETEAEAKN